MRSMDPSACGMWRPGETYDARLASWWSDVDERRIAYSSAGLEGTVDAASVYCSVESGSLPACTAVHSIYAYG